MICKKFPNFALQGGSLKERNASIRICFKSRLMNIYKSCLILILLFFSVTFAHSQEPRTEISMDLSADCAVVDSTYSGNADDIREIIERSSKLHVMTNAVAWGMGVVNVGAEIEFAQHWSFSLPLYFSAWNYFKSTNKFRVFSTFPECRYWLSEDMEGLYVAAHLGLVLYNFAFNGKYRYQCHNRSVPAMGGGVSIGYRMPISKNKRWQVEFSLGAGVYALYYDKFYNTRDTKDGLLIESVKKTYWGLDQISVSFSYMFDLSRKGGKR